MGPGGFRRLQNACDLTTSGWVGSIPTRSRQLLPAPLDDMPCYASYRRFSVRTAAACTVALLSLASVLQPAAAAAQRADSARAGVQRPAAAPTQQLATPRDSTRPPIGPGRAFLYSFLVPGLGQSRLDRGTSGTNYIAFEAFGAAMATKAAYDLRLAREHRHDAIIESYKVNSATGLPEVNAAGTPIPADTIRNRYLGNRVKARRTHLEDWVAVLIFNHLFSGADAFVSAQLWDLPVHVGFRAAPAVMMLRAAARR